LPIFYDQALAAKGFPNPLVKARIAGHEAIFIVDTGASTNILADWYVEAAGIPSAKTDTRARGIGGQTVATRVVSHLQGRWSDGQPLSLDEAIVITFPPYFKSLQLGGLVSPQLLGPAGTAALLDLGVPSLLFMPFERALSELRRSKGSTAPIDRMQPCRNANSKFVNRQYLVPVTVAGVTDLMLVDTGATGTVFSEESKLAHAIKSGAEVGSPSEGIGGAVRGERTVRDVELLRGGRTVALNPSIGKVSEPCDAVGRLGRLGMDALRNCSLILGESEMAFSCAD
jgi:predicted aspartyl protease